MARSPTHAFSRRSRSDRRRTRSTTIRAPRPRDSVRRCACDVGHRAARARVAAARRPRSTPRKRFGVLSGGVLWIVVFAVLLAGVVAINVAVLRLNLQLDESGRERTGLKNDIAGLRAEISSAAAATRIERLARGELGLHDVEPEDTTYPARQEPGGDEPPHHAARRRRSPAPRSSARRAVWIQVGSRVRGHGAPPASGDRRRSCLARDDRRSGEPLAIGRLATTVYANPRQVNDGRNLTLRVEAARPRSGGALSDARRPLEGLRLHRPQGGSAAKILQSMDFAGLGFYPEELRFYPQGPVAAQVLGYAGSTTRVSRASSDPRGDARREAGSQTIVKDPFAAPSTSSRRRPTPGRSVRLTIDREIQAERRGSSRTPFAGGKRGDRDRHGSPYGRDLRHGDAPRFNANRFPTTCADRRRNRAVTDTYEPGSTFKLVTVAAGLQERIITPRTRSASRRRSRSPTASSTSPHARNRAADREADRRAVVQHRHDHDRAAPRRGPARVVDRPLRVRRRDGRRLPGRVAGFRASARRVVGLDDRHRARSGTASP